MKGTAVQQSAADEAGPPRRPSTLPRRPELALFTLAFGVYAYFFQAGGWNQNSRFDLTRAIVEQHTITIDDYADNTGDLAYFGAHTYSEKAPGLSMAAVPVYAALHPFAHGGRPRGRLIHLAAYLSTLFAVSLPSALTVATLFRISRWLGAPAGAGAAVAVAYAFGTLALPYATLFYAHQLVAALLFGAFALLAVGRRRPEGMGRGRLFVVGLLLGSAIASEYPAALIAGVIGLYAAAVTRPGPRVVWVAAGAAAPLLGLAAYHTAAFGGPFTVAYVGSVDPNRQGGLWLGIMLPDPTVLGKVLFSTERGLLHHAPWLALAAPGVIRMVRSRTLRVEGLFCLAVLLIGLLFNSSLTRTPDDWRGGAGVGTRVLVPWLPFFALGVAGLVAPPPKAWAQSTIVRAVVGFTFAALVAVSAGRMFLATAIRPEVNHVHDPFADYYLPLWHQDKVAVNAVPFHNGNAKPKEAWNLGERMGLSGRISLLPLAAFVVAAGSWLAASVRGRPGECA